MSKNLNTKYDEQVVSTIFNEIAPIIHKNKTKMSYQINTTLVNTYFLIGKIIVENEQNGNIRAQYGKEVLLQLSKRLTNRFGSGFSRGNLQNCAYFIINIKIVSHRLAI